MSGESLFSRSNRTLDVIRVVLCELYLVETILPERQYGDTIIWETIISWLHINIILRRHVNLKWKWLVSNKLITYHILLKATTKILIIICKKNLTLTRKQSLDIIKYLRFERVYTRFEIILKHYFKKHPYISSGVHTQHTLAYSSVCCSAHLH